ncbi:hypothetical protein D9M71_489220 [compost metagenome]
MRQALDQHAGGKYRESGKTAHGHRRQGRNHQAAQYHHPWAEAVGQHAPGKLPDRIGGQVDAIEVGHGHLVQMEGWVLTDTEFGDRKRFTGEIEGRVGQPSDGKDLHAPTLDGSYLLIHGESDLGIGVCRQNWKKTPVFLLC